MDKKEKDFSTVKPDENATDNIFQSNIRNDCSDDMAFNSPNVNFCYPTDNQTGFDRFLGKCLYLPLTISAVSCFILSLIFIFAPLFNLHFSFLGDMSLTATNIYDLYGSDLANTDIPDIFIVIRLSCAFSILIAVMLIAAGIINVFLLLKSSYKSTKDLRIYATVNLIAFAVSLWFSLQLVFTAIVGDSLLFDSISSQGEIGSNFENIIQTTPAVIISIIFSVLVLVMYHFIVRNCKRLELLEQYRILADYSTQSPESSETIRENFEKRLKLLMQYRILADYSAQPPKSSETIRENFEKRLKFLMEYRKSHDFSCAEETHCKVELLYMDLLNQYLALQNFEEALSSTMLNFIKVPDEEKDIYQLLSTNEHYFIRNNIHIDRLSLEDLNFLISKQDMLLDQESYELVERTFKAIILEKISSTEGPFMAIYGPLCSDSFHAPNNALVIGFRYEEFKADDYGIFDEDQWYLVNRMRYMFLRHHHETMEAVLSEKYNIPVKIIEYDEFSVHPFLFEISAEIEKGSDV